MIGRCPVSPPSGFIGSLTGFVDCQAETLGSGAWQALAMPGSTLSVVLSGLLGLFFVLVGYHLIFGRTFTVREATISAIKIGFVFALATSWPAYRTLVYDVVVDAPTQLLAEIGPRAGIRGADGTLVDRLDGVDQAMIRLAQLGAGTPSTQLAQPFPAPFGGFDAFALGGGRIGFLLTAVVGLAGVRILAALMLALGPFFIAFLMFDSTRGLFEGWLRMIAGAALASFSTAVVLGLELSLVEPWLTSVIARRDAGEYLPSIPVEFLVIVLLFAALVFIAAVASLRVMRGFRFAPASTGTFSGDRKLGVSVNSSERARALELRHSQLERSRAAVVADAMSISSYRHTREEMMGAVQQGRAASGMAAMSVPLAEGRARTGSAVSMRRGRFSPTARSARRDMVP